MSAVAAGTAQAIKVAARGMKLDDVHVTVTQREGANFTRSIKLFGDLDAGQEKALLAAARQADILKLISNARLVDEEK